MNRYQQYLEALKTPFIKRTKLEFLQPDGSVAFVLDNNERNPRSNAFIQSGNLSVNLQNGKRRQATVTLANLDGAYDYNVNRVWFGQQIRLSMGLVLPDGTDFYLPQGIFCVKDPEEVFQPGKKEANYTLEDKWSELDGTLGGNLDGIYEVPVNSDMFTAISSLLVEDKGNGQPVDNVKPIFTDYYNNLTTTLPDGTEISNVLTPYTLRIDSENGTLADVILGINTMLAGWVGYDQTGALRLDPSQDDILDTTKPVLWTFQPSRKQFLGATYAVKNSEMYNDVIINGEALGTSPTANARATNYDPSSDTNVYLVGRKTYRESKQGYYTDDICEAYASFKLKRMTVLQKAVTIESTQMFHLVENNIVEIRREDKPGSPTERHLIQGFSIPIGQTGNMTINAVSVNDFPIATITRKHFVPDRLVTSQKEPLMTSDDENLYAVNQ